MLVTEESLERSELETCEVYPWQRGELLLDEEHARGGCAELLGPSADAPAFDEDEDEDDVDFEEFDDDDDLDEDFDDDDFDDDDDDFDDDDDAFEDDDED